MLAQVETFADGNLHTLTDDLGRVFPRVIVEKFVPAPVQRGSSFWCDYSIEYLQLP